METKILVCNDCGCKFEVKDVKTPVKETPRPAPPPKDRWTQADVACPECRSYNVTTA
jgi:hypothetical protein